MAEMVSIGSGLQTRAYLARPEGPARTAVIVIHEVWGLDYHIRLVADRLSKEGYQALAPDLLSGAIKDLKRMRALKLDIFDPVKRNEAQPKLRELMTPMQEPEFGVDTQCRLKDCFNYLQNQPASQAKVAVMGFCFGGTYSFNLAVEEPRLKLALAFYGHADQGEESLRHITCPVRAFYGEQDERLMSSLPALKQKMKAAGVDFIDKVYPSCGHAFFNDSNPLTYNEAAARDAWQYSLDELAKL